MKTITEISTQKNNSKRCNLYLDGEFFCGIELITVMQARLKVGMKISEEFLIQLTEESEYNSALSYSLNVIGRNLQTKMKMIIKLKNKGYQNITIKKVIDRLEELNYLNDTEYSKSFANQYKNSKGKRLIATQLKQKGINDNIIENLIDTLDTDDNAAYEVAKKFLKNKQTIDFDVITKCYRRLVSRGFDYETSKRVVERIKKENEISEN